MVTFPKILGILIVPIVLSSAELFVVANFDILNRSLISPPSVFPDEKSGPWRSYIVTVGGKQVDALDLAAKGKLTRQIYQALVKPLKPRQFDKEFYTIEEVTEIIGWSQYGVNRWIWWGWFSAERRGNRWYIPRNEVYRVANSVSVEEASRILHVKKQWFRERVREGSIERLHPWGEGRWRISYETVNTVNRNLNQTVSINRAWEALRKNGIMIQNSSFRMMVKDLSLYFDRKRIRVAFGKRKRLEQELLGIKWYVIDLMDLNKLVKLLRNEEWRFKNLASSKEVAKRVGRSPGTITYLASKNLIPSERVCFNGRSLLFKFRFTYRFSEEMIQEITRKLEMLNFQEVALRLRDAGLVHYDPILRRLRAKLGIKTKSIRGRRPGFYQHEVDLLIKILTEEGRFTYEEKLRKRDQLHDEIRKKYEDRHVLKANLQRILALKIRDHRALTLEDEQILIELVKLQNPQAIRKFEQLYMPLVVVIAKRIWPQAPLADKIDFGKQGLLMAADRRLRFDVPFQYYASRYIAGEIRGRMPDQIIQPGRVYLDELEEYQLDALLFSLGQYDEIDEEVAADEGIALDSNL